MEGHGTPRGLPRRDHRGSHRGVTHRSPAPCPDREPATERPGALSGRGRVLGLSGRPCRLPGKVWIPDLFVAPGDLEPYADQDGLGVDAAAVRLVVEVVSPGRLNEDRDRVRKRREYARAGIPVYVIVDDHDAQRTVTVLTEPRPDKGDWLGVVRVPYGTDAEVPKGPAPGLVIGEAVTGPERA
ncbi:Uma2 family endonuclease [Streptomyces sp. NPDC047853]|uniref:Uma2 family endonuclease n=1 Tax=unclassified Streptomyces TaxID=2593676 RepID=UPI0034527E28